MVEVFHGPCLKPKGVLYVSHSLRLRSLVLGFAVAWFASWTLYINFGPHSEYTDPGDSLDRFKKAFGTRGLSKNKIGHIISANNTKTVKDQTNNANDAVVLVKDDEPKVKKHEKKKDNQFKSFGERLPKQTSKVNGAGNSVKLNVSILLSPEQARAKFRLDLYNDTSDIPVFYNLFIKDESEEDRVRKLVAHQFENLRPFHKPVYINSIGSHIDVNFVGKDAAAPLNTTHNPVEIIGRHDSASEHVTLKALWDYCSLPESVDRKVIYMHSKGSFTPTIENSRLRRFLTTGVLSGECASMPKDTCNICSSRFSPIPHPHVSGNMWLARCDYINLLIDPNDFEAAMDGLVYDGGRDFMACDGRGRYSAEHWAHSHPRVKPCDLYTDPRFTWNYDGIPTVAEFKNNTALQTAPRFGIETYLKTKNKLCFGRGASQKFRIDEYLGLYHETPLPDWWGFSFLKENDDWWPNRYYDWWALEEKPRKELIRFGFNQHLWDAHIRPYLLWGRKWEELTSQQRAIFGELFVYDEESWNMDAEKEIRDMAAIQETVAKYEPNLSFDRCDFRAGKLPREAIQPWYPKKPENENRPLHSFVYEAESRHPDRKRVLIVAAVPRSVTNYLALWSILECFAVAVDHVILSAPTWGEVYIQHIVGRAHAHIPHFSSGQVTLEAKFTLNNRYDVGLWCDGLDTIEPGTYVEYGLINDSVFALRKFSAVFDNIQHRNVHMTSLSYSYTYKWNTDVGPEEFWVESVYRAFDDEGIRIFKEYSCLPEDNPKFCPDEVDNKACIINNFEHDLAKAYPCDKVHGLYPAEPVDKLATRDLKILTWIKNTRYWRMLVDHMDFPIAKANEPEQIAAQITLEDSIPAWQNNPLLQTCTAHIMDQLIDLFPMAMPTFKMAKPYHKRRWVNIPPNLQERLTSVLGYNTQSWNRAITPAGLVGKKWKELSKDQQSIFLELGCSMREFNFTGCRVKNQVDKNADQFKNQGDKNT